MTRRENYSENTELCIICQNSTNDTISIDCLYYLLTIGRIFSYHMNNTCYKKYIKENVFDRIEAKVKIREIY